MNQPFGWAYSCTWVGIGGYNTPDLVQAGTEQDFYVSQYYTYNSNYYAWFEVYPLEYQQEISNFPISPGDQIYTDLTYSNGTFSYYIEDYTTDLATSGHVNNVSNYYDGSTAEWIVERTEIGNSLPNLADFNSVTFTNCNTNSSVYGAHPLGWYTNYEVEMTSDGSSSGTPLANASSLTTSTHFTDYWHNFN